MEMLETSAIRMSAASRPNSYASGTDSLFPAGLVRAKLRHVAVRRELGRRGDESRTVRVQRHGTIEMRQRFVDLMPEEIRSRDRQLPTGARRRAENLVELPRRSRLVAAKQRDAGENPA